MPGRSPSSKAKPQKRGLQLPEFDHRYNYAVAVAAIAVIGGLVLGVFVLRPLVTSTIHNTQALNNKRIESGELKKKIGSLRELKSNWDELGETDRAKILVAMPTDSDGPHLLAVLEAVGAQNGVQVMTVLPGETAVRPDGSTQSSAPTSEETGPAQSVPVAVSVRGSYGSVLNFLKGLEQAPRLMDVKGVTFSGLGNPLQATVSLKAYYQPAQEVKR